ncbi:MAG: inosine/xanthosine triphosphatase [Spirosomaceae bacterium]|nr:inosine/xanthosine triphosphatase [Spirosomataceae bacterium]
MNEIPPQASIFIASKNPVKVSSALKGFQEMFPEHEFVATGISIPSGVSDQPIGNKETFQGALNRATGAKKANPDAHFWVGIEGGNIKHGNEMEAMAWVVVLSKNDMGKARTAGFFLAPKTVELINGGMELGHADEITFGIQNSKQKMGSSGLLTDNVIDRERFYIPAVILALIPFKKPELF